MSQFNGFKTKNNNDMVKHQQQTFTGDLVVIVTHVESPTLFYCRFEHEISQYEELSSLIRKHLNENQPRMLDLTRNSTEKNIFVLVYSVIHNDWCRSKLLSLKFDKDMKPTCAKVWLLDYGSIEFVSWKPDYIVQSTSEIDNFNNGKGLCFACCLYNVKPCSESSIVSFGNENLMFQYDWTSYANYLFKKEINLHHKFRLKLIPQSASNNNDNIICCDLFPIDCSTTTISLSHSLVDSKVAQYIINS